jgi:hypothetical protein
VLVLEAGVTYVSCFQFSPFVRISYRAASDDGVISVQAPFLGPTVTPGETTGSLFFEIHSSKLQVRRGTGTTP